MKRILIIAIITCLAFFAGTQYAMSHCVARASKNLITLELFNQLHVHDNAIDFRDTIEG